MRPGRFDRKILINLPNDEARRDIFRHYNKVFEDEKFQLEEIDYEQLINESCGFSPADIKGVVDRVKSKILDEYITSSVNIDDKIIISNNNFAEALKEVREEYHGRTIAALRGSSVMPVIPNVKLDDIGGYDSVKSIVKSTFIYPISHSDVFKQLGIEQFPGMILYGPPDTGKTTFAKAIATESGLNFIQVRPSDIITGYTGKSAKLVSRVFELARASKPSLLYFDEMEALFRDRNGSGSGSNEIINQLLIEIDGVESGNGVFLLGSTNLLDGIDPAVLRPGRFGLKVFLDLPNDEDRESIITYYNSLVANDGIIINVDMGDLIESTQGMSGAEIQEIYRLLKTRIATEIIENKSFPKGNVKITDLKTEIEQVKKLWAKQESSNHMYL